MSTIDSHWLHQASVKMSVGLIFVGCLLAPWTCDFDDFSTTTLNAVRVSLASILIIVTLCRLSWYYRAKTAVLVYIEPKSQAVGAVGTSLSSSGTTYIYSKPFEVTLVESDIEDESSNEFESTLPQFSLDIPDEPYARQRSIDRLPAPITGVLFAGTDRSPCFVDSSPSLLPGGEQTGGVKIEVTEAVRALAYLRDVIDIEEWQFLGLSCSCEVINGQFYYFSSKQGGNLVEEKWNKEVVTVKSAYHGFAPMIQACFRKLLDNAPPSVSFIYASTPTELPRSEDDFDYSVTNVPNPAHYEHPEGATYRAIYEAGSNKTFRHLSIEVIISQSGNRSSHQVKTSISACGDTSGQRNIVQSLVCEYKLTGRDVGAAFWKLDPWLFRARRLPTTTVTGNMSAGVNAGTDGGGLEAGASEQTETVRQPGMIMNVLLDVRDKKKLMCRALPKTPPGWSLFDHMDTLRYRRSPFAADYTATAKAEFKVKVNAVILSRLYIKASLTFALSDAAPPKGLHWVMVTDDGLRDPRIERSGQMAYHLEIDTKRPFPGRGSRVQTLRVSDNEPVPTGFTVS